MNVVKTKPFALRVLLTVTTGRLLTAPKGTDNNGISDLYEILDWMTGDQVYTHQIPRFGKECKPRLLQWFPELAMADVNTLDRAMKELGPSKGVEWWLSAMEKIGCKSTYDVPKIPPNEHQHKDPVQELAEMQKGESTA